MRGLTLAPALLLAAVVTLFATTTAPTAALTQETDFESGNRLYQETDFAGAKEAYEAVLEAGLESCDLYYNLGNAYFKTGELGSSILSYERALHLRPRDRDVQANLELARSLTADEIEPLPRFWVLSAIAWWVELIPYGGLVLAVALAYLLLGTGLCFRILPRRPQLRSLGGWILVGSGFGLLLFGSTLLAREGVLGGTEWGIILVDEVAVQSAPSQEDDLSAPSQEDDLTLFHLHEGTKVRLDQHTEEWSEVVLEDGRVGWVPSGVLEGI